MRRIGSIPDESQARTLADYLLTLGITTRLDRAKDGWAVWVHREDHVERARAELDAFARDPADPKYRDVAPTARALRKKAERAEREHLRNTLDIRYFWHSRDFRRCPLTWLLIVASIAVTVLSNFGRDGAWTERLFIASYEIRSVSEVPPDGPTEGAIQRDVWIRSNVVEDLRRGEVWRLVTPIFLHFDVLHIAMNMWVLYQLGCAVEIRRKTPRLAALVLTAAVLSNLGQYLYTRLPFFGGMSGVDLALFGYIWMKGQYDPESGLAMHPNSVWWMIVFLIFTIAHGIPGVPIAHAAHLVGLAVGMLAGLGPHLIDSLRPRRE
jgi:GlpG protein